MESALNRRDLLKLLGVTGGVTGLALQLPAAVPGAPLFFTREQFALLDHLTELIIPTDDHSPGAHDAGVAVYIDRTVAEAFLPENKSSWQNGLKAIDNLSRQMHQCVFLKATQKQQIALLKQLAKAEDHPQSEPEKFFTQLKQTTAMAYYSSSIGIHQDINYLGNKYLEQFVGCETPIS